MKVRIRRKGQVTIPADVREAANLGDGDELMVSVQEGAIVLRPINGTNHAAVGETRILSDELHERLESALADVEAGRVTIYEDNDSFLASFADD
jgi:AbrB family looped-hinge helix DNA binding protein